MTNDRCAICAGPIELFDDAWGWTHLVFMDEASHDAAPLLRAGEMAGAEATPTQGGLGSANVSRQSSPDVARNHRSAHIDLTAEEFRAPEAVHAR